MAHEQDYIEVAGIRVEVVRKDIKNLHLGVYPPNGRVRVAAPSRFDEESVRLAVVTKLGWIKRKQKQFIDQERQSRRELITGESHYYAGQRYRLDVLEKDAPPTVKIRNNKTIVMQVRPGSSYSKRDELLNKWYRERLKEQIPGLVAYWEPRVGVKLQEVRIKKMKTHWGTCNIEAARIWLNLELIKKPQICLEYILVHEMIHLIERHHNDRFLRVIESVMPRWRSYRGLLNQSPLAHEDWMY